MTDDIDPRMTAGIDLLARTGMQQFQLRYSDDEEPTIWMAVALYDAKRWDCAAAPNPVEAVMRLCEKIVDGGECAHCHKPTAFDPSLDSWAPFDELVCVYQWDPELAKFRRSCEGGA